MAKIDLDSTTFAMMQTGKPYKSYTKAILGRVQVIVLNPFNSEPEYRILVGKPRTENACIDIWSEKEDLYFQRMNSRHVKMGKVIEYYRTESTLPEKTVEQSSEDELEVLLDAKKTPFLRLKSTINKTQSTAFLRRLAQKARDLEKSEKIIDQIEVRISEIDTSLTDEEE